MPANKGTLVLIKVGNGGVPETFTTIGGLKISRMLLSNKVMDGSNVNTGQWRLLLGGSGIQSLKISGSGTFTDASSEEILRGYSFAGSVNNYQFMFANSDLLAGPFQVVSYERSGDYDKEEAYAMTLESAGGITFTPAQMLIYGCFTAKLADSEVI